MSTCCLCGAEASSAESWTGLVAGIPDPVAVCSEACMEQLWWVVDKGPPFGSAVSQPRSGASAVCGPTTRSSEPPSSSQLPTSDRAVSLSRDFVVHEDPTTDELLYTPRQ